MTNFQAVSEESNKEFVIFMYLCIYLNRNFNWPLIVKPTSKKY